MANLYAVATDNGTEEFTSLAKVASALGVKRISQADLEAGKYPNVSVVTGEASEGDIVVEDAVEDVVVEEEATHELSEHDTLILARIEDAMDKVTDTAVFDVLCELEDTIRSGAEPTEEQRALVLRVIDGSVLEQDVVEAAPVDEVVEEVVVEDTVEDADDVPPAEDPNADRTHYGDDNQGSDAEFPEVGSFKDEAAMKKYVKNVSDADIAEWCVLEGLEVKPTDHDSIRRMRGIMALKALHFPSTAPKGAKKSKSKYGAYTIETLVQMALDNDVEVPDDRGDARILRMYTIMALKKAGLLE